MAKRKLYPAEAECVKMHIDEIKSRREYLVNDFCSNIKHLEEQQHKMEDLLIFGIEEE